MIDDLLTRLGVLCRNWATRSNPWTNVYGLARTLLAAGTVATLAFNHSTTLFRRLDGVSGGPMCFGISRIGLFCVGSHHLEISRWIAIAILLVVASGWYPRFTGPLHWWVSFSLATSSAVVDGGDQVSTVLTLLLLPVTQTDPRKWHWQNGDHQTPHWKSLMALFALLAIRVQVAGIYFHAATAKLGVQEWADGTALYYWFINPDFGAPRPLFWLLKPLLTHGTTLALMTWGSILLELSLFMALVMPRSAWGYFLRLGIAFHVTIALVHGLVSFGFAMIAALILYLRPTEQSFTLPDFLRSRKRAALRSFSAPESSSSAPS